MSFKKFEKKHVFLLKNSLKFLMKMGSKLFNVISLLISVKNFETRLV